MSLFDPFADITRLRSHIERLLEQQSPTPVSATRGDGRLLRPPVDVFEDEESLMVRMDLPEVDRSTLDVQIQDDELTIRAERKWMAPAKGTCLHQERPYGLFHRAFRLGIPIQVDQVDAQYRDGVLTVVLPKAEAARPRKVQIRAEGEAS